MASLPSQDLLLFVSGEPDDGTGHYLSYGVMARYFSAFVPLSLLERMTPPPIASPPGSGDPERSTPRWRLPADQIECANGVFEAAVKARRHVTIVDVNRSDAPAGLIEKWVRPEGIFPQLVRPDGARLEGVEHFGSRELRAFVRSPPANF